jgi:hypothetical protein
MFLILRKIQRDMTMNVDRYSCKIPLFFSDFNEILISRQIIWQKLKISKLVGAELLHAHRQDKAKSRFQDSAKAPT